MSELKLNKDLTYLAPEVWEHIFSFLEKPLDVSNVMRTCKKWEQLLKSKTSVAFCQQVFPFVAKYLPSQTLFSCRLVSKHLKETIDTLLKKCVDLSSKEGFDFHWNYSRPVHPSILNLLEKRYTFKNPILVWDSDADLFMEKITKGHRGNPFLGSSACIQYIQDSEGIFPHLYHDEAIDLLIPLGHHLTTLTLYVPPCKLNVSRLSMYHPLVLQAFRKLPEVLEQVPNLRTLNINWRMHTFWAIEPGAMFEQLVDPDQSPPHIHGMTPFPAMSKLTNLNFSYNQAYSVFLGISLLAAYGRQLTTFICSGTLLDSVKLPVHGINYLLPNMKKLRVNGMTLKTVKKLRRVNLNLEQLQIHSKGIPFDVSDLVRLLNNFTDTLVQLQIDMKLAFSASDSGGVKRKAKKFSNLKHLKTQMDNLGNELFWQLVMVPCKNVEVLDLTAGEITPVAFSRENDLVQRAFQELPKLRKIRLEKTWVIFR